MGLEFLARVRRTTLWLAGIGGLVVATYVEPSRGLAVALGAGWALTNLFLIEKLVVALTGPDRGSWRALRRAALWIAGMLPLFAVGTFFVLRLPPVWLLAGFTAPFLVILLKAVSQLILDSKLWKRLITSPWRVAAVVAALIVGTWWAAEVWTGPQDSSDSQAAIVAAAAQSEHGSDETHASDDQADAGHDGTDGHGGVGGQEGDDEAHGGGHASEGPQKFASVITVLSRAFPDARWAQFLHEFEIVIFALFVAVLICLVALFAVRNPKMVPGPLQNLVEAIVEGLYDFVVGILGPKYGPGHVPFLGTLFVYILVMNVFGLIPGMDSPTSSLDVTVALALVVFFYSQYLGFKELGVVGYVDHMMGTPRTFISWLLVPLMLPIHLMGELAKPISLSARLFGNIFGEDMLLVAFATLGISMLEFTGLPLGVPLHLPFLFLALFTSGLQALVFTVLSTIYLLLMLPHDEHAHEEEVAHAH